MVRPFKWIAAKVPWKSGRIRGANRICDGRIEADVTCFLRSFVLLAPRQKRDGLLMEMYKASAVPVSKQRLWLACKTTSSLLQQDIRRPTVTFFYSCNLRL